MHLLENPNSALAEINLPELHKNLNKALINMQDVENDAKNMLKEYKNIALLLKEKAPSILQYINTFARNGSRATQDDSAVIFLCQQMCMLLIFRKVMLKNFKINCK